MENEKKFRVLIVDDNDIVRETYRQVFQEKGFEAIGAKDGIEGVDLATKSHFDVILTGIIMPRMDGFQLISTLRDNVDTKDVPVAIISHLGREEDRKRALELGIQNFIVQGSMSPREVVDKLRGLIYSENSFQLAFDPNGWDAPALAKKMNLASFKCPHCQNNLVLEITPKPDGNGFDAFLKCPKCDLHL
jgi:CheY-like chemotaxis protein